jgi:excisionase family DNA binding protein
MGVSTPDTEQKLFVGRETAAQMLDVSTRTIDDAIREGLLPASRVGRRVLIRVEALIRYAEREPKAADLDSRNSERS